MREKGYRVSEMSVAANKRIEELVNAVKRGEIADAACNSCNDVGDVGRALDYVTNIGLLWRELTFTLRDVL